MKRRVQFSRLRVKVPSTSAQTHKAKIRLFHSWSCWYPDGFVKQSTTEHISPLENVIETAGQSEMKILVQVIKLLECCAHFSRTSKEPIELETTSSGCMK